MRKGDENFIIPHWAQDVDDSPVGFVNRFAPKFIPLLKSEYPRESASQILDRLVKMWNLGHLYQKNFGNRCGAKCMCLQGWKSVFRFGAMDAVAEARKRKTLLGTHHLEDTLVVPRKRSRIENANRLEAQAERNPLVSVPRKTPSSKPSSVSSLLARMGESASIERKAPVSAQEKHVDSDALQKEGIVDNKLEAYSVTFDTSLPLGFYCVTENIDGQKVCKIDSVAPLGESRKKNILVQEGTCGTFGLLILLFIILSLLTAFSRYPLL